MRLLIKNTWIAVFSIFAVMVLAGCGDEKPKGGKVVEPSPAKERKRVNVREWVEVKSGAKFNPTNNNISAIAVSKNGKSFYVTANGGAELFFAKLEGAIDKILNDASWEKLALTTTNLDGSAGKAEMAAAVFANRLVPTKEGVLVERSVANKAADASNGVAFLKDGVWAAAWSHENADRHFPVDASNAIVSSGVVAKDGVEYPVVFQSGTNLAFSSKDAKNFTPVKLGTPVKSHTTNTFTAPVRVARYKNDAIIVDSVGVHTLQHAIIGTDGDWLTKSKIDADTATFGSDAWKFAAVAGANNAISDIAISGDHLFVALHSDGTDNTGGVAVINLKTPEVKPLANTWNKVNVLKLALDNEGKVWAVTATGLFLVGTDGTKGTPLAAQAQPQKVADMKENAVYDKNETLMPTKNITDAIFYEGNLIIATSDKGLIVRKAPVMKIFKVSS